jgi:16S rRNA (guanine527-N7)-methyltransferase
MDELSVKKILQKELLFSDNSIKKIYTFVNLLLDYNNSYNLISKNTIKSIWVRHILDSAQIIRFIDIYKTKNIADLGTGAGFPGIIIAIFDINHEFHVKLYEKSPVKRKFLKIVLKELDIKSDVLANIYDEVIDSDTIVCRAFKKLDQVIQVSREIIKKPHKLIVLKGQNAQEELNKALKSKKYPYKIEKSMTSKNSEIIIINFNK